MTESDRISQDLRTAEGLLVAIQTEQARLDHCSRELVTVRGHYNNRQIEYRELTTKAEVRATASTAIETRLLTGGIAATTKAVEQCPGKVPTSAANQCRTTRGFQ